jgi:phosphatidate cytidylyltransferase
MFRQRVLTAMVLVPLVILAIFFAKPWVLGGVVMALVLLAGWEWTQLIPIKTRLSKCFFMMILFYVVGLCAHWTHDSNAWLIFGLILWGLIFLAVVSFPKSQTIWGYRWVVAIVSLILLPLFANTFAYIYLQTQGKSLVLYLLCLVWATDTGAYFAGKYTGNRKLIPSVSPGKTIEGSLGGFLLAMVVAAIGYGSFHPNAMFVWFLMNAVVAIISMLGDLFISMLKRRTHLKDTGRIFPGHGGVLDRIDSLIAAVPFFYCGLMFL